nr:hypothetical protein [Rhodoferax sp.]
MLMRTTLLVIAGAQFLLACNANASDYCESARHPQGVDTENWIVSCRDHPTINQVSILAIASPQANIANSRDEDYDLEVSLVDTRTKKTLASGIFKAKLPNGGGPRLSGIAIDTGRYFVSPGLRAFGVRAELGMSFTSSQELHLFVTRGKDVVSVLSGAETHIYFTNRGSCQEQTREAERTLVMDKTLSSGFYDILVQERLTDMEAREDKSGACELLPTKTEKREYRLKFDGKEYRVPNEMKHFDCRVC